MTAIIPGTAAEHEGLWLGSIQPQPNHRPGDRADLAARLWKRRAANHNGTLDQLKASDTWSCRPDEIPFWEAVRDELFGEQEQTPAPIPEDEIGRALSILAPDGVFEIRGLGERIGSGYFDQDHLQEAVKRIVQVDDTGAYSGIYITLNPVKPDLLARRANRFSQLGKKDATSADSDIIRRRRLLIDADAKRPSGISSTDTEHEMAFEKNQHIAAFLSEFYGFPVPVVADSGNGGHLLYWIDLPNDAESTAIIKRFMEALDRLFTDDVIQVDTTVFNASRISKLYGTMARKGDNTPDRPHRRSRIISIPDETEIVSLDCLRAVADLAPQEEQQTRTQVSPKSGGGEFDLDTWLTNHGASLPSYREKAAGSPWRSFYIFDVCPWDSSHTDRSAFMGQMIAGPVVAGCHHNGCRSYDWHDLRKLVGDIPKTDTRDQQAPSTQPIEDKVKAIAEYAIDVGVKLPDPDVPSIFEQWACTDIGNSDRLIRQYGRDVLYSVPEKMWYIWDGSRYRRDETLIIQALARRVALTVYKEADQALYDHEKSRLAKWAIVSSSQARIKSMIEAAAPLKAVTPADMDAHPYLLNCLNGTIDLKTGAFREARREDRLTKCTGVNYDRYADCPLWVAHLKLIYGGDVGYIKAIQEFLGYSLIDGNPEQVMGLFTGIGKNGKSVTMGTIARVLGDYAITVSADSMAVKRSDNPDAARSDLAAMKGARIAWAIEGERGAVLAESLIKQLTGEDKIRVRRQYEHGFEFRPGATIIMVTNHKPEIRGTDLAIWRRLLVFPHDVVIDEKKRDFHILDKLAAEGAGILNWLLVGLARYLERGRLELPEKVKAASNDYRFEQDLMGDFLRAEYKITFSKEDTISRSEFYNQYKNYCISEGEEPLSNKRVARSLKERGFGDIRKGGVLHWWGFRKRTKEEQKAYEDEFDHQEVLHAHS